MQAIELEDDGEFTKYACPHCHGHVEIPNDFDSGDGVWDGNIACPHCSQRFQIVSQEVLELERSLRPLQKKLRELSDYREVTSFSHFYRYDPEKERQALDSGRFTGIYALSLRLRVIVVYLVSLGTILLGGIFVAKNQEPLGKAFGAALILFGCYGLWRPHSVMRSVLDRYD